MDFYMSRYGPFFIRIIFPHTPFFCNKFDCFLAISKSLTSKSFFCYYYLSRCCSLISLLSICSNGHFFVSIMCVDYMCYNDYCGTSTPETLPKPLSAVPSIIKNTKKKRRRFTSKPELRFISFEKLVDCDEFSGIGTTTGTTNTPEVS